MQQNVAPLVLGCIMVNVLVLFESLSIGSFYTKFGGEDIG
jgi:hypothetical protein